MSFNDELKELAERAKELAPVQQKQPSAIADIVAIGTRMAGIAQGRLATEPCHNACGRRAPASLSGATFCDECLEKHEAERLERKRLAPIPGRFRWARWDAPELAQRCPPAAIEKARASVLLPKVVLVGQSGAGKTSLACAMVRDRIDARQDVAVALAWRIAPARARHPLGEDEAPDVRRAMNAGLLLLDDMGSERNVPSNAVPDIVFERDVEGRPTWITTWMTPEKMSERYGDGIARRVFEGAVVIDCAGASGQSGGKT